MAGNLAFNKKSQKFDEANRKLKGIESHHGFLGDETLLRFAGSDEFRSSLESLMNERLRAFRDAYRSFDERSKRLLTRNDTTKYAVALKDWTEECIKYLGYKNFKETALEHPEKGHIHCLLPTEDTHSVAVFFAVGAQSPVRIFDSGRLTGPRGECHYESGRGERLSEQVERALKQSGMAEAVVIMPHNAYYFRSESTTAEQCLEVQWHEMMTGDFDDALALATFLLRADFFSYSPGTSEDLNADDESEPNIDSESNEGDEDGDEEAGGSSGGSVKLTPSSLLFKEDLEQSRRITEELHQQVVLALEYLVNERIHIDPEFSKSVRSKTHNEKLAYELFKDGLFVLYRILFVLYAEARGFLPIENKMFASFYSLEHLRDWSERYLRKLKRGAASTHSTYLWGALGSIFTLLRRGVTLGGDEIVSPYNGQLFAPDRAPLFDKGPPLRDEAMAKVFAALTRVGGDESARRLHFGNLGVEQLGAVYEALLAQKPVVVREKSVWVPAHGGGTGLVTEALADALGMERFAEASSGGQSARRKGKQTSRPKGRLDSHIDPRRPGFDPTIGTFIVAPLGGAKRQTASFYTPPKLADFLVRRTLKPLIEGISPEDILKLRIVEPAMGSGGFIIATVRYMAAELLKAKKRDRKNNPELRGTDEKEDYKHLQRCKREIIENCIFGVDINPLAIELARTSLYLEALVKGEPLPFLHHRLKSGNSLIGADFQGRALSQWEKDGPEFPMLFDLPIQYIKVNDKVWTHWDDAYGDKKPSDTLKSIYSERMKALKAERKKITSETWGVWATRSQTKVNQFLQLAKKALEEFDKSQTEGAIVDTLDDRHKDHIGYIPDMDPVIIEAYEVSVDESLLRKRRSALQRELGEKKYQLMVKRQRSYYRLKALGDLAVSLWYWPLDLYRHYPDHSTFRELADWLLDESTLQKGKRGKPLSKAAITALKIGLRAARRIHPFHWDIEYAQIFGDMSRTGFDALISNPPWKVVGVKDKEIYPHFDPQFLNTKPAQKKKRVTALYEHLPQSSLEWYHQSLFTSQMTEHWRKGQLSEAAPEGKVDLAALFTLRSERIVNKGGRTGLVVSRSSIFVNKATKNIRERFFDEWGLQEACSFINRLGIFEIASYIEFTLLIGQHGLKRHHPPRFVHGLTDPNTLDVVAKNLEVRELSTIRSGPKPAELTKEAIGKYFSKDNFSIPGITDPRQVEIAMALHRASGPVVYLDEMGFQAQQGINRTNGPKAGYSFFASDYEEDLPSFANHEKNPSADVIPLMMGRNFNILSRFYGDPESTFEQYGNPNYFSERGIDLSTKTLVWRGVSQIGNQRTLIPSVIPPKFWGDHNVWLMKVPESVLFALAAIFSAASSDFLVKTGGSSYVGFSTIAALPIPSYSSNPLTRAIRIAEKINSSDDRDGNRTKAERARIDALVWLHFGFSSAPLDRENLSWLLNTQFECLSRHDSEYKHLVLAAYDEYTKDASMISGPTGQLFSMKISALKEKTHVGQSVVGGKKKLGKTNLARGN